MKLPYEVIVSDGASKDNTLKIAKRYANKIVISKKRSPAIQRNCGAKYSKGSFLIFVDADTILLSNTIEEILKVLNKENIVLATCPILPIEYKMRNHLLFWFYNQFLLTSIKTKKPQVTGVIMGVKREDFFKVGGFNEKKSTHEDFDFSERIAKIGRVGVTKSTCVLTSTRRIEKWSKIKNMRSLVSYFAYLFTGRGIGKYEEVR
jgi:glycosyltransferase involved in cell wall biosynthesis